MSLEEWIIDHHIDNDQNDDQDRSLEVTCGEVCAEDRRHVVGKHGIRTMDDVSGHQCICYGTVDDGRQDAWNEEQRVQHDRQTESDRFRNTEERRNDAQFTNGIDFFVLGKQTEDTQSQTVSQTTDDTEVAPERDGEDCRKSLAGSHGSGIHGKCAIFDRAEESGPYRIMDTEEPAEVE